MKKMINEAFEWSTKEMQKKDGSGVYYIAYINPQLSKDEDTFAVKDTLKSKFGMSWNKFGKYWYMNLASDENTRKTQIEKYVKPAVAFLKQNEKNPNGRDVDAEVQNIIAQIDAIINGIGQGAAAGVMQADFDEKALKGQLETYKNELIAAFQDGTFKEKLGPIIKFRQAQGTKYSLANCILILVQRPDAKMVKSKKKWNLANKDVRPDAKPIALWLPIGNREKTPEEKRNTTKKFLDTKSKQYGRPITEKDLNVGERENLIDLLNATVAKAFKLQPSFYDISDTVQMEGKEDLVGSLDGINDVEWFDGNSPEDEKSARLYTAVLSAVQSAGLRISYGDEKELGGARGVSMGGEIKVLQDVPKNAGTVSTLVHEFAHEILHHAYLSDKNGDFKDYFVGRPAGRQLVEQQAEMAAWIVMRYFGYDMQQAVNYMGCWGADERSAAFVFDSIANAANKIIDLVNESMVNTVAESKTLNESAITGLDVAAAFGQDAVEIYNKSKRESIGESFKRMLDRINNADVNKR